MPKSLIQLLANVFILKSKIGFLPYVYYFFCIKLCISIAKHTYACDKKMNFRKEASLLKFNYESLAPITSNLLASIKLTTMNPGSICTFDLVLLISLPTSAIRFPEIFCSFFFNIGREAMSHSLFALSVGSKNLLQSGWHDIGPPINPTSNHEHPKIFVRQ